MTESRPRWEIILTRQAEKSLYRLSKLLLQRLDQATLALAENPYPPESHQLAGYDNLYRLPVAEWRITYAVEAARLVVLILEIAPQQQPERYRLEESDEDLSPVESQPQDQTVISTIIDLRRQYLAELRTAENDFFYGGPSLLKRLRKAKIRLLIVDALAETRETLRKSLFAEPEIEVVGMAANGEEAIQMTIERQPDIVLMDTNLPDTDGFAACKRISHQFPSTQVILMSAWGTDDYVRRAMVAGAREFLIKPFSGQELMTSIRRVYQATLATVRLQAISHLRGAFNDLKQRIQNQLIAELDPTIDFSRPNELGRSIVRDRFEQILAQENIILSRSEGERLFEDIVTEILQTELDETQKRTLAQWFNFFKLGNKVEISLSVADLSRSLSFYKKLGLEPVDKGEKPYPWAVVSDGQFYLGLHQQVFSSPSLSYFTLHGLSERMDHLPKLGVRLDNVQKLAPIQGMLNNELLHGLKFISAEFESPEGQRVLLADISSNVETTPTSRKFFSKYEAFGELSLNTKDVNTALAYWEKLGFECLAEGSQPYPWVIVSDGRIRLGLHQTPKLTRPTITYFAPDMPERLKRWRRRGIKFVAEHKDKKRRRVGAVIESPDGQQFFFFTGEAKAQSNEQDTSKGENKQELDIHGNSPRHEGAQWYLIYSYSGNELKVRRNLLQRIEAMGLQHKIFQVVVPSDSSVPLRISGSSFLSGSLLVEMVMDEDSWYVVKNTPGVTGFVGANDRPTPLPLAEVNKLLNRQTTKESEINGSFKIGQKVRIIEGPFEDFMGTVSEVDPDRARIKVEIAFFGQEKSIEFDFLQVERA